MAAALAVASCSRLPVYSHYESISTNGWNSNDSVTFTVIVKDSAAYSLKVGLRVNNHYPYTRIALTAHCRDAALLVDRTDTFSIDITDDRGQFIGHGTSIYQYDLSLPDVTLGNNDTLNVTIAHTMSQQPLQGVTDLGITLQ